MFVSASGASSIFSQSSSFGDPMSGPASLQTQNSGMFGPSPTQQQFQQQPQQQQRSNMVSPMDESKKLKYNSLYQGVPPKGSDLDSLFTDLDPLGTGMSKPFVDKKDFFTASKKAPRLTGASDDSLNNVGLHMSDPFFVESNLGASAAGVSADSAYTNTSLSSSSALSSSKFSDSFWSPAPASTPPPSRPAPGHVPRITTEAAHYAASQRPPRPSHGPSLCSNQLRVALPPEDATRRSSSPGLNTQTSNTYGSILELEASPRRFRKHEIPDFYAASQDSLAFNYGSGRYGGAASLDSIDDSLESSLNLPMPSEPPPALPQRPPKLSSVSPPPLPPKKQSVVMSNSVFSQRYETPSDLHHSRDDIYDFIHENTAAVSPGPPPLPSREADIGAEDLAKMSVVELSQRMVEGKLPAHLTGMSLFELVDFISKQTREMSEAKSQENLDNTNRHADIKSSFSDNFMATKASKSNTPSAAEPAPGYPGLTVTNESQSYLSESSQQRLSSSITSSSSRLSPNNMAGSITEGSKGFDDDFSKFKPSNSFGQESQQPQAESSSVAQFDKYAVFRELQMEEEISNALKSPSEDFKDPSPPVEEEDQLGPEPQLDALPDSLYQESKLEHDIETEAGDNEEESFFDVKNDSFPEPEIHEDLDTNNLPQSEEPCQIEQIILESPSQFDDPISHETIQNGISDPVMIGNGQAYILEESLDQQEPEVPQSGSENTAFEENFTPNINESAEEGKSAWATFEDEKSFEFSSFLSSEDQNKLLNKSQKVAHDELETFSSGWGEPLFQPRSQSTDPTQIQESGRQKKFDPFSARPGTEPPKEWASAWNDNSSDAAFPSVSSNSREKSQNSLKMSNDSIFNSPFTDNFVTTDPGHPMGGPGMVTATPPMFESGRASNTSRGSANSAEFVDSVDVFDENNSFANSNFKIQAKTATTKLPNSESVDIFRVSTDPFDDEFFK